VQSFRGIQEQDQNKGEVLAEIETEFNIDPDEGTLNDKVV
jgi:hypothetical protein